MYIRSSLFINDAVKIRERFHVFQSLSIRCDWFGVVRVVFEGLAFFHVYVEAIELFEGHFNWPAASATSIRLSCPPWPVTTAPINEVEVRKEL